MRKIFVLSLIFTAATTVRAQQKDTTNSSEMQEVVVTGQYRPQSVRQSVYQVRVIPRERIEKQGAARLQDVLNNELNIRFTQDPATGGSDITMMGMKGQNVKILLDGMPLVGRQGTSNEININQIDINSIERIEIVEGPMSVVYGADALAGVIAQTIDSLRAKHTGLTIGIFGTWGSGKSTTLALLKRRLMIGKRRSVFIQLLYWSKRWWMWLNAK